MRIVGGKFRGRTLQTPQHDDVRPTSDRVRESLFNILTHGIDDFDLEGARVLDLFAGTGALGLEAISRGAGYCLFVENNPQSRALIQHHILEFGLGGISRIFRRDATDLGRANERDVFDLVFLDPPYGMGLGERALQAVANGGWLRAGGLAVIEEATENDITLPPAFTELDRRTYGSTQILMAQFTAG